MILVPGRHSVTGKITGGDLDLHRFGTSFHDLSGRHGRT